MSMRRKAALSALAASLGLTSDELVARVQARAPKFSLPEAPARKPAARKMSASEAIAAADRVLADHHRALGDRTYAAVFGDDGSPSGTAAPVAVAAADLTYERVWPSSNATPPADPLYDAVFGKD